MNTNDEPTKNLRKIFEKSSKNGWKMRKIRLAGNAKCDAYSFVVSRSEQARSKIRVSGARSEGEPGRAPGETARLGDWSRRQRAPALAVGARKNAKGGREQGIRGGWRELERERREKKRRQLTEVWLAEYSKVVLLVSGWLHGRREA